MRLVHGNESEIRIKSQSSGNSLKRWQEISLEDIISKRKTYVPKHWVCQAYFNYCILYGRPSYCHKGLFR